MFCFKMLFKVTLQHSLALSLQAPSKKACVANGAGVWGGRFCSEQASDLGTR